VLKLTHGKEEAVYDCHHKVAKTRSNGGNSKEKEDWFNTFSEMVC